MPISNNGGKKIADRFHKKNRLLIPGSDRLEKNFFEYTIMDLKKHIPLSQIIFRYLTGFGAGVSGSIVFLLILLAGWSIVGESLSAQAGSVNEFGVSEGAINAHPLFVYLILFATFLSVLMASSMYALFMTLVEERFTLKTTALAHAFFGNIVLMVFLLPAYIITSRQGGLDGITNTVLIHVLISGIFTFFILEALHWNKYFLVSIYALAIALALYFLSQIGFTEEQTHSRVLLAMPLLFGFIAMSRSFAEMIYQWIFRTYGNDVLNAETRFGSDYEDNSYEDSAKED